MDRYESGRPRRFSRLIPRLFALVLSGFLERIQAMPVLGMVRGQGVMVVDLIELGLG